MRMLDCGSYGYDYLSSTTRTHLTILPAKPLRHPTYFSRREGICHMLMARVIIDGKSRAVVPVVLLLLAAAAAAVVVRLLVVVRHAGASRL